MGALGLRRTNPYVLLVLVVILGALSQSSVLQGNTSRKPLPVAVEDDNQWDKHPTEHQRVIDNDVSRLPEENVTGSATFAYNSTTEQQEPMLPWLLLHVGPPKTGTSYLQCSICKGDAERKARWLEEDGWLYVGTCPGVCRVKKEERIFPYVQHGLVAFMKRHGKTKVNRSFKRLILHPPNRTAPVNTLVVFEGLHILKEDQIQVLAHALSPYFRIRIVVAYRPLYEWIPSKYNSLFKPYRNPAARVWPGQRSPQRPKISGKPLYPFDWVHLPQAEPDFWSTHVQPLIDTRQHIAHHVFLQFHNANLSVEVLRLPSKDEDEKVDDGKVDTMRYPTVASAPDSRYLDRLICGFLGTATRSCRAVREGKWRVAKTSNPSESWSGDQLAVAAWSRQWVDSSLPRQWVAVKVDRQLKRLARETKGAKEEELPIVCNTYTMMKKIFQLSWDAEQHFFKLVGLPLAGNISDEPQPTLHRRREALKLSTVSYSSNRDQHWKGFQGAYKKYYCWLDAEQLLDRNPKHWQSFFQSLKSNRKGATDDDQ